MDQGERDANRSPSGYYAPSPLRYIAIAITLTGVVLLVAFDQGSLGTGVLAAGLLISAADDRQRGEWRLGVIVAGLAIMLVASEEDWSALFYVSAAVILFGAASALHRALRPATRPTH